MEMCYDGALVMPSNYVLMAEDEMTYLEGGKYYGLNIKAARCKKLATFLASGALVTEFASFVCDAAAFIPAVTVYALAGSMIFNVGSMALSVSSSFFTTAAKKGGCHIGYDSTKKKWTKGYGLA